MDGGGEGDTEGGGDGSSDGGGREPPPGTKHDNGTQATLPAKQGKLDAEQVDPAGAHKLAKLL